MIMLRYIFLVQLYHWTTFYKQTPWAFLVGVLLFPCDLAVRLTMPANTNSRLVAEAINTLKSYWEVPGTIPEPPKFVKKRFLRLEEELKTKR